MHDAEMANNIARLATEKRQTMRSDKRGGHDLQVFHSARSLCTSDDSLAGE